MKGCLLLIVGMIVGALIVIGVQLFVATPPPLPQAAPANDDMVILLRNEFLTRLVRAQLLQVGNGTSFSGVVVQAEPDQTLVLVGTAAVRGIAATVPVRVVLRPSVSNNRVNLQVVRAELGTLSIPGQVFSQVQGPINQEINRSLSSTAYRIVNVSTTVEGLLVNVVVTG